VNADMTRKWFAIRTKPRDEIKARDQLLLQGFEVYLPLVNTRISHARKVSWQPRAFFAGYLFLHLRQDEQRWTTIRSTIGVLAPVSFGTFYPPIPESVLLMLQSRHDEQGFIGMDVKPESPFKSGEKVRLKEGALKGFDAVFVEMRGEDRALLLLDWMNKNMRVLAQTGDMESVEG